MKFFLDANIPYSILKIFQKLNLDAIHARDAGLNRATDSEIFLYAAKNKHIIVTKDLEFANIQIFPTKSHKGAIVLRLPSTFNALQFSRVVEDFLNSVNINDLENAIAIVKLGKYRIRKIKKEQ